MPTLRVRALIAKGDPRNASSRTVGEVEGIFEEANAIWRQADVRFEARVVEWEFEPWRLEGVVEAASERKGDTDLLREVVGDAPREITALYVRSIGGSSGKVFRPKKTVVVVDRTKVSDARTTAHEIGHLFGLEHWLDHPPPEPPDRPPDQLMARTQPGTRLIPRDLEQVRRGLPASGLDF